MPHKIILTPQAPAPIGPYSQAVEANGMLFVSGQVALHPRTNELIISNIEDETHQVMLNVGEILKAAGKTYGQIVKTTIFLKDMNNFGQVNKIYGQYFEGNYPARETVEVARLPKDVNVEISVIAI